MFNDRQFIGGAGAYKSLNSQSRQFASGHKSYADDWAERHKRERDAALAQSILLDTQVEAGTHAKNPDGSVTEKKPGFLDYLNPFGRHGLFGQENTARVARTAEQGGDIVREKVDEFLGEKGNDQFDSGKDVARFAINLVPGMIEAFLSSGKNFNEAATGERVHFDEQGNMEDEREKLTGTQRAAAGAVGVLDTVGLAVGGSGKLLKEVFRKPLDAAAKGATKSTIVDKASETVARSTVEGVEESLSTVAEDLQDDSQLSEDWLSNMGKGALLGFAAGGIFDVSGRAIGATRDRAKTASVNKATGTSADTRSSVANRLNEATDLTDSQRTAYANYLTEIAQDVDPVSDADMRIQEFNSRADEALERAKAEPEQAAETSAPVRDSITPEKAQRLVEIDSQLNERLVYVEQEMSKLRANEDPTVKRLIASDGTDVTATAQRFENEIRDKETQIRDLQQQAEGIDNNTGEATVPEGVDPSEYTGDVQGRGRAAEEIIALRQEIENLRTQQAEQFEMLGGVQEVIDTQAVRTKARELKRQRAEILDWKIRNNLGESVESLQQKKRDIENGVVSDEFVRVREPVETIDAAVALARESDHSDVSSIQRAAVINQIHREAAQQKLDSLWTQDKYEQAQAAIDGEYKAQEAVIKEMPGPRQQGEIMLLDDKYASDYEWNESRLREDADEVQAAQMALEIADDIDANIVERANSILESDPMAFGKVDPEEMIEIESAVDIALTLKKTETVPETITPIESEGAVTQAVRNAADAEETGIIIDEDPRLSDQAATVVADQLGEGSLKGELWDSFIITTRDALKKLENGDKLLGELDYALNEMGKSDALMAVRARMDKWKLTYNSKEASDQSIAYWDQGEPLSRMKGESERRFGERQKAADSVKAYFDDAAQRRGLRRNSDVDADIEALEATRTPENSADIDAQIAQLNSSRMVDNYFAHIHTDMGINVESAAEAIARLDAGINDKGNPLTQKQRQMLQRKIDGLDLGTQQVIAQRKIYEVGKDGHAIKRQGAEGWSRDIPFVLEVYQRSTNRAVYMQPALDNIKQMTSNLPETQLEFVETALKSVAGKKVGSDRRLGDKGTKVLRNTRRLSNAALMGASVRTMMLQPTSILNNWRLDVEQGGNTGQFLKSTFKSIISTSRPLRHSPGVREFLTEGGMQGSWSTNLKSSASTKAENMLFSGIAYMDRNMRYAAYDQGKSTYLKNNAKDPKNPTDVEYDAAKRAGVEAAQEAQFGLGPLDVPLAQSSEIGKAVFQLQQFNMKQMGREIELLMGDKDGSLIKFDRDSNGKIKSAHFTKKGATNLVKTIAGYSAVYALYTQMQIGDDENSKNPFGLGFEDMIPFGEQVMALADWVNPNAEVEEVQAVLPPIYTALVGRGGQDKGVAGHLFRALTGGDDIDRGDELASMLQGAVRQFLPGGTQMNRSFQGAQAVFSGESQNKSGSTRFLVDQSSGWNVMKGLVAGQYATTEGQEWLRNGMNTIPKSETIEYEGQKMPVSQFVRDYIQDPGQKALWIGYYATKQNAKKELSKNGISTTDVVKNIRLRLTAGQINQAQANHEVEKHNQMLIDLYRPYMQSSENIPKYVTLDFMENILVKEAQPFNYREQ